MKFLVILERTPSLNDPAEHHVAETFIADKVEVGKGSVYIEFSDEDSDSASRRIALEQCMALWVDRVLLVKRGVLIGTKL